MFCGSFRCTPILLLAGHLPKQISVDFPLQGVHRADSQHRMAVFLLQNNLGNAMLQAKFSRMNVSFSMGPFSGQELLKSQAPKGTQGPRMCAPIVAARQGHSTSCAPVAQWAFPNLPPSGYVGEGARRVWWAGFLLESESMSPELPSDESLSPAQSLSLWPVPTPQGG